MSTTASQDHKDLIYGADWRAWRDPEPPDYMFPAACILDKHLGTPIAAKTALIVDDAEYSYAAFIAETCRCANGLAAIGLEPGERLLLFGTDSLEYLAIWFGAIRIGVVPVVVSDLYKSENLRYFLDDTAAKTLFIDSEQVGKLKDVAGLLPGSLKKIIVRDGAADAAFAVQDGRAVTDYAALVAGQPDTHESLPRHSNDVTYMFYSGGTTGTAKGITHLAHDFMFVPERHGHFWEYGVGDVVHATSKKYFTHGLWPGVLIPLYWGGTSVTSRHPPTPDNVLGLVAKWRVTKLITVPTIIKNMLVHVAQSGSTPDFGSVNLVVSASEKIPPEVFETFRETFGVELFDSIGSSEVTYEWIANRQKEYKSGSLGKPLFGVEIKLVDPDGNEVTTPDTEGEAWVKSPTACFFYWRKYDKSRETFIGPWTRTGDTLYFDDEGFYWFAGRSDDLFKVKGMWTSPIEIEATITAHADVLEAAVVSYEDTDGLTKPKAFVVLQPGRAPSDELTAALKANVRAIGGYKVPEEIEYVAELPRTTLLKIDRRALREQEKERRGQ